ncbi:MAG: hypothetical protein RJB38_2283 [Pseudomonadota bacterium]|jgi:hypothetical protein
MSSNRKAEESSGSRVARSTFQQVLMDLPGIGWLFLPLVMWWEHRREKREKAEQQTK